jgi:hypothetical protein
MVERWLAGVYGASICLAFRVEMKTLARQRLQLYLKLRVALNIKIP